MKKGNSSKFQKILIIISIIFITALLFIIYKTKNNKSPEITTATNNQEIIAENPSETTPPPQLELSDEELAEYAKTYEEPAVIFLREAIDSYQEGIYDEDIMSIVAIEKDESDGKLSGLDSFEGYYQSKFIVYQIVNNYFGGVNILIIFVDKPDQIFTAWVYKHADDTFHLRGFWNNPPKNQEGLKKAIEYLQPILDNKELSI